MMTDVRFKSALLFVLPIAGCSGSIAPPMAIATPPSSTAVTSSATALGLTWNGTPATTSGELEAYATGVPMVNVSFPTMTSSSSRR